VDSLLAFALAVFGTYRIARMLALEEGTFGVFEFIRAHIDGAQATWLGRGLNCPLCISFWVALAVSLLMAHHTPMSETQIVLTWLGVAGASVALYQVVERVDD